MGHKSPEYKWKIYVLIDPRDNEPRYIGMTTQSLQRRLQGHINKVNRENRTAKNRWILELDMLGLKPEIKCIDRACSKFHCEQLESKIIRKYLNEGHKIYNTSVRELMSVDFWQRSLVYRKLLARLQGLGFTCAQAKSEIRGYQKHAS